MAYNRNPHGSNVQKWGSWGRAEDEENYPKG